MPRRARLDAPGTVAEAAKQLGVSTSAILKIIKRSDSLVNLVNNVPFLPLMFRMSYRCSYCMAVCPAGEDVKQDYFKNKKDHVKRILKPLKDRTEPVYVAA